MKKIEWHLEKRKLSDLIPYFKNPRIMTTDQCANLTTSLDKFGLIDRPCVNLNGTIIGGHQRLKVISNSKDQECEVWVPNRLLDNAEVEELNIRLNKNTAEWDWEILGNEYMASDLVDWGFTDNDLQFDLSELIDKEEEENKKMPKDSQICPKCGHEFSCK